MIVISHRKDPQQQLPNLWTLLLSQHIGVVSTTGLLKFPESGKKLRDPFLHTRVPVVFDCVIGSSFDLLRDISPAVPVGLVEEVEDPFFLIRPAVLLDMRV